MTKFPLSLMLTLLLPLAAAAQTPTAYAERSQLVGQGQEVHLFGLSTKNADGVIRCYDVAVTLAIGANGVPATSAPVATTACPKIKNGSFTVGDYATADNSLQCTLGVSSSVGRNRYDLSCLDRGQSATVTYTFTWYSGPIVGHPMEASLLAQGLDTVPGSAELAWGQMTGSLNKNYYSCFDYLELLSARQVGTRLTLLNYGRDTSVDCPIELIKVSP